MPIRRYRNRSPGGAADQDEAGFTLIELMSVPVRCAKPALTGDRFAQRTVSGW